MKPTKRSSLRRTSSIGGHLARQRGGAGDGLAIGDDIEGSVGIARDPEQSSTTTAPTVMTATDPELHAELRGILETPSDNRTYDDILPIKQWLLASPWGKRAMDSVVGREPFRIDEARAARHKPASLCFSSCDSCSRVRRGSFVGGADS